jgi:hypothetical protein
MTPQPTIQFLQRASMNVYHAVVREYRRERITHVRREAYRESDAEIRAALKGATSCQ